MNCKSCGEKIESGMKFCPGCGGKIDMMDWKQGKIVFGSDEGEFDFTKKKKTIISVIAGFMLFLLVVILFRKFIVGNANATDDADIVQSKLGTFREGIAKGYEKRKFMVDTNLIMDDYHDKGYTYIWLVSHEVDEDTDTVYLEATYVDENGYYYITQTICAMYAYWGETLGWMWLTDWTEGDPVYDFSGFNNTYWKVTDREKATHLAYYLLEIKDAADIVEADFYFAFSGFENILYNGKSEIADWTFRCKPSIGKAVALVNGKVYIKDIYLCYREDWIPMTVSCKVGVTFDLTDDISNQYRTPSAVGYMAKPYYGATSSIELITEEEFNNVLEEGANGGK